MAFERVPADIRRDGGVARMSDPLLIEGILEAVTIPVMAKARIGHFAEAQVLQSLDVDFIDESEVLTPADEAHHIDKWPFTVPFVCGATNLGEALRRISEGAAMIRPRARRDRQHRGGRAAPALILGDQRAVGSRTRRAVRLGQGAGGADGPGAGGRPARQAAGAVVLRWRHRHSVGCGVVMQLGPRPFSWDRGSSVGDPARMASAIVEATADFNDPDHVAKVSRGLGEAMRGLELSAYGEHLADRGGSGAGWA